MTRNRDSGDARTWALLAVLGVGVVAGVLFGLGGGDGADAATREHDAEQPLEPVESATEPRVVDVPIRVDLTAVPTDDRPTRLTVTATALGPDADPVPSFLVATAAGGWATIAEDLRVGSEVRFEIRDGSVLARAKLTIGAEGGPIVLTVERGGILSFVVPGGCPVDVIETAIQEPDRDWSPPWRHTGMVDRIELSSYTARPGPVSWRVRHRSAGVTQWEEVTGRTIVVAGETVRVEVPIPR